jgi:surface antigen
MGARILLVGVGLLLSSAVLAMNWGFLRHAPVSHFTEKDWDLMKEAAREALANAPDGETVGWSNSDSGAFGTVQPLNSYEAQGMTCRRTEVYNNAGGTSGTGRFDFCQQDDGTWRAAPQPKPAPAAP